jgi:hypothetical protein
MRHAPSVVCIRDDERRQRFAVGDPRVDGAVRPLDGLSGRCPAVHVHPLAHTEALLGEPLPLSDGDLPDAEVKTSGEAATNFARCSGISSPGVTLVRLVTRPRTSVRSTILHQQSGRGHRVGRVPNSRRPPRCRGRLDTDARRAPDRRRRRSVASPDGPSVLPHLRRPRGERLIQ